MLSREVPIRPQRDLGGGPKTVKLFRGISRAEQPALLRDKTEARRETGVKDDTEVFGQIT